MNLYAEFQYSLPLEVVWWPQVLKAYSRYFKMRMGWVLGTSCEVTLLRLEAYSVRQLRDS